MKYLGIAAAMAMVVASGAAQAVDPAAFRVASDLGNLLASESFCGLKYDQAAIQAFVAAKVPAADMSFTGMLSGSRTATEYQFKEMTPSDKTAHCTQTRRVARAYKFIAD